MLLTAEKSECEKNQKIIVSRDKGSSCQHRAINDKGQSDVRQYQLDGMTICIGVSPLFGLEVISNE